MSCHYTWHDTYLHQHVRNFPRCTALFNLPCSDHLKIHKKTHDTQKPYQCSVCNRGYNTAAALTAHMQNHKAKLTAHALNQLLKDAQAPVETHTLTQLLRDSAAAEAHSQSFNHFLKDGQKVSRMFKKRNITGCVGLGGVTGRCRGCEGWQCEDLWDLSWKGIFGRTNLTSLIMDMDWIIGVVIINTTD